jgi:hypothetical protein
MRTPIFQRFERCNEKNMNICSLDEKIIVLIKQVTYKSNVLFWDMNPPFHSRQTKTKKGKNDKKKRLTFLKISHTYTCP